MITKSISFITANYIAEHCAYDMKAGWNSGHQAIEAVFKPEATFSKHFKTLIARIRGLGFNGVDLYTAHLGEWATESQIEDAKEILSKHGVELNAICGTIGTNVEQLTRLCQLAHKVGAKMLSGPSPLLAQDRATTASILRENNTKLALENHPEKSGEAFLSNIGSGDEDVIGGAIDTGWFGTYGVETLPVFRAVKERLFHVHLKDVKAKRSEKTGYQLIDMGHETCALGDGIIPIKEVLLYLEAINFQGVVSFEHEPEEFDPSEDSKRSLQFIKDTLSRSAV